VKNAADTFFDGRPISVPNVKGVREKTWHGLDHDIDTKEEADIACLYFHVACTMFGAKCITEMVRGKIMESLEPNSNKLLVGMILSAATNDEMSLDSLYILMHLDPIALVQDAIANHPKAKCQRTKCVL
jgi:hypothetical protein